MANTNKKIKAIRKFLLTEEGNDPTIKIIKEKFNVSLTIARKEISNEINERTRLYREIKDIIDPLTIKEISSLQLGQIKNILGISKTSRSKYIKDSVLDIVMKRRIYLNLRNIPHTTLCESTLNEIASQIPAQYKNYVREQVKILIDEDPCEIVIKQKKKKKKKVKDTIRISAPSSQEPEEEEGVLSPEARRVRRARERMFAEMRKKGRLPPLSSTKPSRGDILNIPIGMGIQRKVKTKFDKMGNAIKVTIPNDMFASEDSGHEDIVYQLNIKLIGEEEEVKMRVIGFEEQEEETRLLSHLERMNAGRKQKGLPLHSLPSAFRLKEKFVYAKVKDAEFAYTDVVKMQVGPLNILVPYVEHDKGHTEILGFTDPTILAAIHRRKVMLHKYHQSRKTIKKKAITFDDRFRIADWVSFPYISPSTSTGLLADSTKDGVTLIKDGGQIEIITYSEIYLYVIDSILFNNDLKDSSKKYFENIVSKSIDWGSKADEDSEGNDIEIGDMVIVRSETKREIQGAILAMNKDGLQVGSKSGVYFVLYDTEDLHIAKKPSRVPLEKNTVTISNILKGEISKISRKKFKELLTKTMYNFFALDSKAIIPPAIAVNTVIPFRLIRWGSFVDTRYERVRTEELIAEFDRTFEEDRLKHDLDISFGMNIYEELVLLRAKKASGIDTTDINKILIDLVAQRNALNLQQKDLEQKYDDNDIKDLKHEIREITSGNEDMTQEETVDVVDLQQRLFAATGIKHQCGLLERDIKRIDKEIYDLDEKIPKRIQKDWDSWIDRRLFELTTQLRELQVNTLVRNILNMYNVVVDRTFVATLANNTQVEIIGLYEQLSQNINKTPFEILIFTMLEDNTYHRPLRNVDKIKPTEEQLVEMVPPPGDLAGLATIAVEYLAIEYPVLSTERDLLGEKDGMIGEDIEVFTNPGLLSKLQNKNYRNDYEDELLKSLQRREIEQIQGLGGQEFRQFLFNWSVNRHDLIDDIMIDIGLESLRANLVRDLMKSEPDEQFIPKLTNSLNRWLKLVAIQYESRYTIEEMRDSAYSAVYESEKRNYIERELSSALLKAVNRQTQKRNGIHVSEIYDEEDERILNTKAGKEYSDGLKQYMIEHGDKLKEEWIDYALESMIKYGCVDINEGMTFAEWRKEMLEGLVEKRVSDKLKVLKKAGKRRISEASAEQKRDIEEKISELLKEARERLIEENLGDLDEIIRGLDKITCQTDNISRNSVPESDNNKVKKDVLNVEIDRYEEALFAKSKTFEQYMTTGMLLTMMSSRSDPIGFHALFFQAKMGNGMFTLLGTLDANLAHYLPELMMNNELREKDKLFGNEFDYSLGLVFSHLSTLVLGMAEFQRAMSNVSRRIPTQPQAWINLDKGLIAPYIIDPRDMCVNDAKDIDLGDLVVCLKDGEFVCSDRTELIERVRSGTWNDSKFGPVVSEKTAKIIREKYIN